MNENENNQLQNLTNINQNNTQNLPQKKEKNNSKLTNKNIQTE